MGKTAVVTGATSGMGLAVARSQDETGAFVVGGGRLAERNQAAREQILAELPGARVAYWLADLSEQGQVRQLAAENRSPLDKEGFSSWDVPTGTILRLAADTDLDLSLETYLAD